MTTFQLIHSDYTKQKKYGASPFAILFFTQGFWATFQYRIAHFFFTRTKFRPLRIAIMCLMYVWQKGIEITTGISIPASAKIGHSFYVGHFGGIILHSDTIIGSNCNISQGVTIGISGLGEKRGTPVVGNNVYIAANSVVAGKIVIGDNALIGACSFVNVDVKENSVLIGVPATVISERGSNGYI
jgi:serine O-acetyltransferase